MKRQRILVYALIVLVSAGLAQWESFGRLVGLEDAEYATLDWRQRTTPESFQPGVGERESDVVLVLFDSLSVAEWSWEQPFPRGHLADVIDALAMGGARSIAVDVFLERLYPDLNALDGGDDRLQAAIANAGNVILAAPLVTTDSGPVIHQPHPAFTAVAADVGSAELPPAFDTYRYGNLAVRSGSGLEPSLALATYAHATGVDVDELLASADEVGRVSLPGLPDELGSVPPASGEGGGEAIVHFPVHFIGPPSSSDAADPVGTFQATASSTVVSLGMDLPFLLPEYFQDKIVMVGTGFHEYDQFRTPFYPYPTPPNAEGESTGEEYGWMFGVEIHANAIQNMLDQEYIRELGRASTFLLLLLVAATTGGAAMWKGAGWGGAVTAMAVLGVVAMAWWLWAGEIFVPGRSLAVLDGRFLWVPMVTPALAGVFGYVGSVAYVSVVEGREKRFIKGAFGKYVSPAVVAEIAESPEALQLGGQKRELSLLFSDLAGFTTLSEQMDPQDLLSLLNEYLTHMTQVVMDEGGTLDKYIGDAIMAFWNAPQDIPDHPDRALRTMILMQRKMDELNAQWRERDPEHQDLLVRIGVNSGEVVVGNVGGEDRFDYSAIGDSVNLAARLEPANKTYDTLNMASEYTLNLVDKSKYRIRELDLIAVKGKEKPVKVYEVLELTGTEFSPEKEEMLRLYEAGMKAYKDHQWDEAARLFQSAAEALPTDGPSRLYVERCRQNAEDPPPADWDFVVRRTVK